MLLRAAIFTVPLIILAFWLMMLRPVALGGPVQYVIVQGHSMEPTLRTDYLVVVKHQDDYEVGDVISFETPIGPVMHRIVDGNARDGFVTKGDNNEVTDPWHPTESQIVGRALFWIPGGARLRWIAPVSMALSGTMFLALGLHMLRGARPEPVGSS